MQRITGSIVGNIWSSVLATASGAFSRTAGTADRAAGGNIPNTNNITFDSGNSLGARAGAETRGTNTSVLPIVLI